MQEVSRVHSTKRKKLPIGKEQIQLKPLSGDYVSGFIDGEGSFSVSISCHKTLRQRIEVRAQFEIELRADDREILERIVKTVGCDRIYDCTYARYGWYPHVKLKIGRRDDLTNRLFPFLDKYKLQGKKKKVYKIFKEIVVLQEKGEHLTKKGIKKILALRNKIRKYGKKHNFKKFRD
jgi:hypothetical protein